MFNFGFSYIGCLYLIILIVPNILWKGCMPKDYTDYAKHENILLKIMERVGEILVCTCLLVFSDFNIRISWWSIMLILSFVCMMLYEINWLIYFRSSHTMKDMCASLLGIPVAGATLPVMAFAFLAVYGCNSFLLLADIIFAIGHIGIHLGHRKEVLGKKKQMILLRILKWLGTAVIIIITGVCLVIMGIRNINYFSHFKMIQKGVDIGRYIELGGQEQYILERGMNKDNPVIIYLHGGPSSSDTYITYSFSDYLVDDYTVIAWDQRGCGRTYIKNKKNDATNASASFEQALLDLDELVDYAINEYGKDKVIIAGHSYGTILGSVYALEHPEKVCAYVGIAQVISLEKTDIYSYEDALAKAIELGDDTSSLEKIYEEFVDNPSISNIMKLRSNVNKYHPIAISDKTTWYAITSPYFGFDDLRWFLKQLGNIDEYVELNKQLFDYTREFDIMEQSHNYEMPVYYISGSCDWVCPTDSIGEYIEGISAPDKEFVIIDGPGHNIQYSTAQEFAQKMSDLLIGISINKKE